MPLFLLLLLRLTGISEGRDERSRDPGTYPSRVSGLWLHFSSSLLADEHTPRRCLGWPGTRALFYPHRRLALDAGGVHVSLEEDSLESIHNPHLWLSRHRVGTEDTLSHSSRASSRPLRPRPRILAFSRSWSMDGQPFAHPATEVVLGRTNAARHMCLSVRRDDESEEESQKNSLDG